MTPINAGVVAEIIRGVMNDYCALAPNRRHFTCSIFATLTDRIARDCLEHGTETEEFFRACGSRAVDGIP